MTSPNYGFIFNQLDTDTIPPVLSDFSVLGVVLPSDDALSSVFPLNVPVDINTGDTATLAAMGNGPLYSWALRVNNQLADLQRSARAVVVRVPMAKNPDGSENVDGTIANIVGDPGAGTGLYALLKAPSLLGVTPRVVGAPGHGYTGKVYFGVTAPVITDPGANYTHPVVSFDPPGATATATVGNAGVGATGHTTLAGGTVTAQVDSGGQDYRGAPAVTFTGGGGTGMTGHAVVTNGAVSQVVIDTQGTGYTSAPALAIAPPPGGEITVIALTSPGKYPPGTPVTMTIADSAGGTGAGATATITLEMLQNPICAALPAVLNALLAHAPVCGPGTTKADAIAWRGTLSSQRLVPVDNWEIVPAGAGDAYMDGAATVMGTAVRVDFQHGGYPFWSWANQPVQGILGLKRVDALSLLDGATDGQELLAVGVGVTARGDLSDTSVADSGWILICYQNAATDPRYNLLNKTRGRDFTNLALIKSIRLRLGRDNITPHDVQAVLNDMTAIMSDLKSRECVIGFVIGFSADANTPDNLRAGRFRVYDNSEEPAPILQVTIDRALDRDALVTELAQIASGSNSATG